MLHSNHPSVSTNDQMIHSNVLHPFNQTQEKKSTLRCASLRAVEFFPHGKRGERERGRSARWISSLDSRVLSLFIWKLNDYYFPECTRVIGVLTENSDMQAIQKQIESWNTTEQQSKQIEFHTVWGYNTILKR